MSTSHEVRGRIARRAFEALGPTPSDSIVLMVQCDSAHHLATVHRTAAGQVFHSVLHSKSHGSRDFVDTGHHASRTGADWFDLLDVDDPTIDDGLPAGCECGPHTLSRRQLLDQIRAGVKRVIVE
jgi:hypothetical protein